jgi:phage recombination protein Bet
MATKPEAATAKAAAPQEESPLDKVIAATPEVNMRDIWAGKDQRFTTYDGRICTLSIKLCETVLGNPYRGAPEAEKAAFIAFCITNGLDPLRKQVHFVKYGQEPAAYIVDWHVFVDRAQRHPAFDGYETGVVWSVKKGEETVTERGQPCDYERDEHHRMIGGWARVHRRDRKIPVVVEVPLAEMEKTKKDGTPTRFWKGMTTTMTTKVPAARALRNSFPDRLGDLYIEQETAIFQALQQPDLRSGDTLPMETLDDLKKQLDAEDAPAKPEENTSIAPQKEAGTDDEGGTDAPTTTKLLTGLEDKDQEPH